MKLEVGKAYSIVRGPGTVQDPLRNFSPELWEQLANSEEMPEGVQRFFLCSDGAPRRGGTPQVHFGSLVVAVADDDGRYFFTATDVRPCPGTSQADSKFAIGSFNPSTTQRIKGTLVAVAEPVELAEAPSLIIQMGGPVMQA